MAWKTYLVIYFGTDQGRPSEIVKKVESLGFNCTVGAIDFVYRWEEEPTKDQILELADKLTEAVVGTGTVFNIDTQKSLD